MTSTATPQVPVVTCTRAFAGLPESVSAARSWVAGFVPGTLRPRPTPPC